MTISRLYMAISTIAVLFFAPFFNPDSRISEATTAAGCVSSSPASGGYTVMVCFTSPASGSTLTGDAIVTATVSVTAGTSPGIQRVVFYLDGVYLLTDYTSTYSFTLPSARWIDGSHTLSVEARMRDGFISQRGAISVQFSNGVTSPPGIDNQFHPVSGIAAASGSPFIVAAGGDGASGETYSGKVSDMITSLNPNLFLYLGDVYEKGSPTEFYNWYGTLSTYFGRLRSITNPTIGNHEYSNGSAAAGYFGYWDGIPNYYSYNAGGWHFVSLNSNSAYIQVGAGSAQYNWLQQDLAAVPAGMCTLVYYHHPRFNIGPEGAKTTMNDIWQLMAQRGVDVVLNGHDHDYQRWVPLDANGQPSTNGITEFVAGAAGHGLQDIGGSDPRVAYSNDSNPTTFGVLLLQLNQSGANFNYRNTSGTVLDSGVVPCVPTSPDTVAPSTPGGFAAIASSSTRVDLNWTVASDNVGVSGYTIFRNGTAIATVPAVKLSFSDTSVTASTTYSYSIDAFDLAGNHSQPTAPAIVMTPNTSGDYTFSPAADAYVNASFPSTNYGSATTLRADGSPDVHSYLRFTVQGLGGKAITQARLQVYANTNSTSGINALSVSNNSWTEPTITYNNAPALGNILASSAAVTSGTWITLDVTSYVTAEGTYTIGLTTPGSTALSFQSREASSNRPRLLISVGDAATATPTPTSTSTPTPSSVPATNTPTSTATIAPSTNTPTPTATGISSTNTATPTPTSSGSQSVTLIPVADSYVNSGSPTMNYGSATVLRADASPDLHGYVRFTVSGLGGLTITQARLLFYINSGSSSTLQALAVSDNTWGEKTVNYSNAPALGSNLATSGVLTMGTWVSLDVSAYVTAEGIYSFGIITPGSTAVSFASRESGANAPQLIIDLGN